MNSIKKKYIAMGINVEDTCVFETEFEAIKYIAEQKEGSSYMIQPSYESISPENNKFRVSICMPIYGRPERTLRAIESVLAQNINGWQLILIGDSCPHFQRLMDGGYIEKIKVQAINNNNEVIAINLPNNYGGYGYHARNLFREMATGSYGVFLDNDDVFKENHLSNYLSGIEHTDFDFCYFNTWLEPMRWHREADVSEGRIGHSEIIVKLDFLKKSIPESQEYGHDFKLIDSMVKSGAKYAKCENRPCTYVVKSLPDNIEQGID